MSPLINFVYGLKILRRLKWEKFRETVEKVQCRSGLNPIRIGADMLWCGLLYGAAFQDYELCQFEKLSGKERKTYLTRGKTIGSLKDAMIRKKAEFLKIKLNLTDIFGII